MSGSLMRVGCVCAVAVTDSIAGLSWGCAAATLPVPAVAITATKRPARRNLSFITLLLQPLRKG